MANHEVKVLYMKYNVYGLFVINLKWYLSTIETQQDKAMEVTGKGQRRTFKSFQ